MDFYKIRIKETRSGVPELYPSFRVGRSTDLMVRGGNFYAIWDEKAGMWSTDEYDVARLIDEELYAFAKESGGVYNIKEMGDFDTGSWSTFQKYLNQVSDNSHQLDQKLTFANTPVKKTDYASKRLPYSMAPGSTDAWDELVGTLYSVEERAKIEWAIGAIITGDSKTIQKFLVFYGPPASGKGTILDIVEKLFQGYTTTFNAKDLGSSGNQFATEVFKNDPLVAIQGDGDLSRIQDNAKLNSIISHEKMAMNAKFQSIYTARVNAFLMMGTNNPVKISDAKSGIIRRLIDVHPTGVRIQNNHYNTLMSQIDFELGAIANHCLEVYLSMGKNYYGSYRPLEMMFQTDMFFNFIEANYDIFKEQDGVSLTQAYGLYKEYCKDSEIDRLIPKYKFREELRNYFDEFKDRAEVNGQIMRSYYAGFNANKFKTPMKNSPTFSLVMDETKSLLDEELINMPAQLASKHETPRRRWADISTRLGEIDTSELHFVKVPENHIVIDFDLKDENGAKSLDRNLEAASNWPPTYAELSKGGSGVHLHYIYEGDVEELSNIYSEGIEVKTLLGDSSLRRRLTKCNNIPIATISSGLPLKEKRVLSDRTLKSEKGLREMLERNLNKEFHPSTKSSIDFIKKILDDAYESGMEYDVTDMRSRILAFAQGSTNQAMVAIRTVMEMKFSSEEKKTPEDNDPFYKPKPKPNKDGRIAFFDVEVYPNLFVICWKYQGDANIVRMINPSPQECEGLLSLLLVGFNCRRYDNHMIYARIMGYSIEQLYKLSQRVITHNDRTAMFGEAYSISYADIWDYSSEKQTLKKWQIELGLPHMEMDIPWDQPVPDELIPKVVEYCCNDVLSTEAVHEARKQDFIARQILADVSGLTVNDTTQRHTAQIIFGNDRHPQSKFNYTHLQNDFPGYLFDAGKSTYRGEVVGEGGYVYAEHGMYENVVVLDIASMHPTSIEQLDLFGEYTPNFSALKAARIAIKHGDYESARHMLDGKLEAHLDNPADADALSYALKIVINTVYGLTSAKFDNPFRDIRNRDNIVAKRGALFMVDLKHFVQERGFQVVHIKTDSIKIPNATPEIIEEVTAYGKKWGYDFEHEATYEKMCLVNDAVYVAKYAWAAKERLIGTWYAVGAQFQHPYVYKTLFTNEDLVFDDFCETKQVVKGAIYMDFDHDTPTENPPEGMKFIGKTGRFVPVAEGQNGGRLVRVDDGKAHAVTGTKGYLWLEASVAASSDVELAYGYFEKLADAAVKALGKFGDTEWFLS